MKVLLIQPPYLDLKKSIKRCQPPLGLAYLASAIKDKHEVRVLDAVAEGFEEETSVDRRYIRYGLNFDEIKKRIKNFSPDIVGISCLLTTQATIVYDLCRAVKELNKKIITVIGGAHPSAMPGEALNVKEIDYVVIGEGEETFNLLLESLEKNQKPASLDGLGYKEGNNIIINDKKRYMLELDKISFPDWSFFPLERYFNISKPHGIYPEKKRFLPVLSSRGCPNNCIFCSIHNLWGRSYRKRSAENILREIEHLIIKYKVEEIYFEDDNLTLDKKRVNTIFKGMIEKKLNIKWSTPNGVFAGTLDDEMLRLMKESGCRALSLGVESGDKHMLAKVIDKHFDLDRVPSILQKTKTLNIETTVFFVLGIPGETKKSLKNTFAYARRLSADHILYFFATPLPGTRLSDVCRGKGIVYTETDYKNLRSENTLIVPKGISKRDFVNMVKMENALFRIKKILKSPRWAFRKIIERAGK